MNERQESNPASSNQPPINQVQEFLAGLTVSFVAISLGAAFGVASGRGALAGILSAGVIALITAAFGGTRVQCSGPTAPMTAVTVLLVTAVGSDLLANHPGVDPDRFINMVIVLTGAILILASVFRLGRFIQLVPKTVISGFMNGIAVLIWVGETRSLFGIGGKTAIGGAMELNVAIALATLGLIFLLPSLLKKIDPRLTSFLPATLAAIIVVTLSVSLLGLDVQRVALGATLSSLGDLGAMFTQHMPTEWAPALILLGLPFALQLAMLAYLDTLLTSLVVDKKVDEMYGTGETTAQNRELAAQGVANGAVAFFGGIPGAQATIRSVLILNEGARTRVAGVMVGIFVLIEMLILQDLIALIPQAVFAGVLIKVGYDVFDWEPVRVYVRSFREPNATPASATEPRVPHLDMLFIAGTTLVTVMVNLNVAVVFFCVLFFVVSRFTTVPDLETAGDQAGA